MTTEQAKHIKGSEAWQYIKAHLEQQVNVHANWNNAETEGDFKAMRALRNIIQQVIDTVEEA